MLFAGTEFGIYVSFDDGDHWQPLQLNLPVSSIRDINVHGDDLIVATHGRSFWILDDITPLRQIGTQSSASTTLYQPATVVRVDNDTFLASPLPPEEPTAKNPPDGAIFDYYLSSTAQQVKLEIFDAHNQVVRRFVSGPSKEGASHPPLPIAARWFPEPQRLGATPGMHRFVWDLRWSSSGDSDDVEDEGFGAPHGPRAVPGMYQVKLTVDGTSFAQPLKVEMDPRSGATTAILAEQLRLGLEMFGKARQGRRAAAEIDSVKQRLGELKPQLAGKPDLLSQLTNVETAIANIEKGNANSIAGSTGLETANTGVTSALRVVESGDRTVPAQAIEVYKESDDAMKARVADWSKLKTTTLAQFNEALRAANLRPIQISAIEEEVEELATQ